MMIKDSMSHEDITVPNVYGPNIMNIKIITNNEHPDKYKISEEKHRTEKRNRQVYCCSSRLQLCPVSYLYIKQAENQ